MLSQLRLDLVSARLKGNPTALDGAESAEVATAAVAGVDALEGLFGRTLPQLVLAAVVPVAVLVLVASLDLVSAGLMLLTLPLVPVFFWLIGRATGNRARERWQAMSLLATHFLDVVRGLPTLRAFNRGEAQVGRIEQSSDEYRTTTMGTLRLAFLSGTVLELAATLGVALVAVTVGVRLVEGGIAFEPALTVLVLAPELYLPLRNLAAGFHASADGVAVADRLLGTDREPPVAAPGGTVTPPSLRVRRDPVRRGLVLVSRPAVGLPSRTSALEISAGRDRRARGAQRWRQEHPGIAPARLSRALGRANPRRRPRPGGLRSGAWRAQIAWVPQNPTLFRGSVADNIRLGAADASDERVREAARLAGADSLVAHLPDGYATLVGEGHRPLSTGERQRVALARAFLRDAPLVVLDEPTANLDPSNAKLVADAIDRLRLGRTVLLIAHDARLAALADRTITIDAGRIVWRRRHERHASAAARARGDAAHAGRAVGRARLA